MSVETLPEPVATVTPPPRANGLRPFRFTREQYYRMGDLGFFQGKRVELIFGEIVEMSPIGWRHAIATGLVSDALQRAFPAGFHVNVQQPVTIPGVAAGSEPQPDVTVVPGTRRDYHDHPTTAALVVEVADSSLPFDIGDKVSLYASAGVAEYWVLDLPHDRLFVYRDPRPEAEQRYGYGYFHMSLLGRADAVAPLAAPAASIPVADLLP